MQGKKRQFIFGLIGLGCGIVLSGIFNLLLLLNTTEYKKGITLSTSQITQDINEAEIEEKTTAVTNLQSVKDEAVTKQELQVNDKEYDVHTEDESTKEVDEILITVTIPPNMTATHTCKILEEAGVISDAKDFRDYISERQMTTKLNEGTFVLSKNMAYNELLEKLMID